MKEEIRIGNKMHKIKNIDVMPPPLSGSSGVSKYAALRGEIHAMPIGTAMAVGADDRREVDLIRSALNNTNQNESNSVRTGVLPADRRITSTFRPAEEGDGCAFWVSLQIVAT